MALEAESTVALLPMAVLPVEVPLDGLRTLAL